ncbi:indole-3-glycerol phosphate synthase TrpC [Thermicanus aegyptius]|uniref:indole-3-glycerol phosphate synthase TrpC n=1 Tax=Thermicanus aegyptius TaxID=94009 RepID=UPI0004117656|nr:indole-3-glycerol phosphate synthase TrpC [Thermicanus aegyptius]
MLDQILAVKRKEAEALREKSRMWKKEIEIRRGAVTPAQVKELRSLKEAILHSTNRIGLIAEVKKASPSKGLIRPDFDVEEIASEYREAGVDALSVLTDISFFQGDPAYLPLAREVSGKPVLRKDFLIDEAQLFESVMLGADAILLIVAALSPEKLSALRHLARELGLEVLIEVHDERELELALPLEPDLLGVNNRNLKSFVTNLETTRRLAPLVPEEVVLISESGISTPEDVEELKEMGVDGILVGEHFMRQKRIGEAVRNLVGA